MQVAFGGILMRRRVGAWLVLGSVGLAAMGFVGPGDLRADGWHNAALATSSLDQWMSQVKQAMPKVELSQKPAAKDGSSTLRAGAGAAGLREALARGGQPANDDAEQPAAGRGPVRGGSLQANMTPQEQALMARQVAQCLEILAYMDPKNIFPREFPTFQMQQIPAYRQAAKGVLAATGDVGSQAVVAQIRSHLTGAFQQQQRDVSLSNQYAKDLLELLGNAFDQGNVSVDEVASLREATIGNKPPELAAFAKSVRDLIEEKAGSLPSLLDWYGETRAALEKTKLRNQIEKAITESPSADLVTALGHESVDPFRITILRRLANDLPKLNEADLLEMLAADLDDRLLALVEQELARRSPTYADVQTMIEDFARHARSPDERVARYARAQLVNAFLRAPITQCLKWLGQGDEQLNAIIWKQVDVRIARADADRK
ncbi:MAG: hypothetical protein KDA55_11410, partial [Planctomycetales bacterium]|nr:hypothetical protein [Planctomycetales bacterium]